MTDQQCRGMCKHVIKRYVREQTTRIGRFYVRVADKPRNFIILGIENGRRVIIFVIGSQTRAQEPCALAICKQNVCQQRTNQFITPSVAFAKRISPRSFNPTSFFFPPRTTYAQAFSEASTKKNAREDRR